MVSTLQSTKQDSQPQLYPALIGYKEHQIELSIVFDINPEVECIFEKGLIRSIETFWRTIHFDLESTVYITQLIKLLDGKKSISAIAQICELVAGDIAEIFLYLYELGVIINKSSKPICGLSFQEHMVNVGRTHRAKMLNEVDLFSIIINNNSRTLLLGSLIETYHFVNSASSHISLGIAQSDGHLQRVLSKYLKEEYWHGQLLKKGLLQAGISQEDFANIDPLPATLGLIHYLQWVARTNMLSYGIFLGINEAPSGFEEIYQAKVRQWQKIESLQLLPKEVLAPFREHELIDYQANHGAISIEFFKTKDAISADTQAAIKRRVWMLIELQRYAYQAAVQFYDVEKNHLFQLT